MTMPTPDSQLTRVQSQHQFLNPTTHSILDSSSFSTPRAITPITPVPQTDFFETPVDEDARAIDFAEHSWDLATGGLKTLTAKRELPYPPDRRPKEPLLKIAEPAPPPRSDLFAIVILACVVLMLISGGIVLFMMIAP